MKVSNVIGTNISTPNLSHAEQLLQQLKVSFLEGLDDRCGELELIVLSLDNKEEAQDYYNELYRCVHSLKGSAGTHGISLISTICHHFEDYLNIIEGHFENIDGNFIDQCLVYIDLIKNTAEEAKKENPKFAQFEDRLAQIRQKMLDDKLLVLIIESSSVMLKLCQTALSDLPVQTIVVDDGLKALERILKERFDFIITGNTLKTLNGVALISAMKVSESINSNTKTIMLTSTPNIRFPIGVKPNYMICKSSSLVDELHNVARELMK